MIDKERIKKIIDRGCNGRIGSEQALRDSVIGGGLLEAMGWSFDNGDWSPNYPINFGTTTHYMDYYIGKEGAKWILEAKNPANKRLDRDKDVKEILSYMKQTDSKYGILYNGKELLAFKLGSEQPFYEWSCGKKIEIFYLFSNDRFPEKLEKFIQDQEPLNRFQNYIMQNTNNIKDQIIDLVARDSQVPKDIVKENFPLLISLFSNANESEFSQPQGSLYTYQGNTKSEGNQKNKNLRSSRVSRLGPHLTESKAKDIILQILKDKKGIPLKRLEIVNEVKKRVSLNNIDKEILPKSKIPRWEAAVRWAVTDLNNDGLIRSLGSNQWVYVRKK